MSDPKALFPVLVGDWSEEAEKKILATLDPVGAMAQGDADADAKLIETVNAESLWAAICCTTRWVGCLRWPRMSSPRRMPLGRTAPDGASAVRAL